MKLIVLVFHFFATFLLIKFPPQRPSVYYQQKAVSFHPALPSVLSLGRKRMLSSFYWITTMIQADIDRSQKEGEHSWPYYRFLQISHLDPFFYHNYTDGGLYLSVIKDDIWGAKDIYERGLKIYGDDFWLNYFSAFNDFFELGDSKSALKKYRKIVKHPLAEKYPYLYGLTAKIESADYGLLEAEKTLTAFLFRVKNKIVRERIRKSLYAIRAERDLECLNEKKQTSCSRVDYNGSPYLKGIHGLYTAQEPWQPFRINEKVRIPASRLDQ